MKIFVINAKPMDEYSTGVYPVAFASDEEEAKHLFAKYVALRAYIAECALVIREEGDCHPTYVAYLLNRARVYAARLALECEVRSWYQDNDITYQLECYNTSVCYDKFFI